MSLTVESKTLHCPTLDEVALVLENGISKHFANVEVKVVECPDLTQAPYKLAGAGLNGSPRIADVGGVPNLIPLVRKEKIYDIKNIAELIGLPNAFIIGAGAGPHPSIGVCCEMMTNIVTGENCKNGSRICKISGDQYELQQLPEEETTCALMQNLFASEGLPGKVIKVKVSKRTGDENFVTCMRKILDEHYKDKCVGLGGTFRLCSGTVKCHVMPDYSKTPLKTDDDINKWLHFFNMAAPMVFLSVFISRDPGLDLRVEHTHGYGEDTGTGGHYHYDVTPETVEYEGYFNVAEYVYRVDRPTASHDIK